MSTTLCGQRVAAISYTYTTIASTKRPALWHRLHPTTATNRHLNLNLNLNLNPRYATTHQHQHRHPEPEKTDIINPPASTRPPPLTLPPPLPATANTPEKLKRYMNVARAYIAFYKTGLKNVYHNYRASIPLRRELGMGMLVYVPVSPRLSPPLPPTSTSTSTTTSTTKAPQSNPSTTENNRNNNNNNKTLTLPRSHYQLLIRSSHDVRRIIPFTILLILCGELTPLVVLALGNTITPYTCRVPNQVTKTRTQKAARKSAALAAYRARGVDGSVTRFPVGSEEELGVLLRFADPGWVGEVARREEVGFACAALGIGRGIGIGKGRLRRYVEYLWVDDLLIRRGGGVGGLNGEEVRIAVEERGGVDVGGEKSEGEGEGEKRKWLEKWLRRRA